MTTQEEILAKIDKLVKEPNTIQFIIKEDEQDEQDEPTYIIFGCYDNDIVDTLKDLQAGYDIVDVDQTVEAAESDRLETSLDFRWTLMFAPKNEDTVSNITAAIINRIAETNILPFDGLDDEGDNLYWECQLNTIDD